jgi:hypothetical protein
MSNWKSIVALFVAIPLCAPAFTPAFATQIEDHYRAQMKMRVCGWNVQMTAEEEDAVDLNADEDVVDINLNSEDLANIFNALQAEYDQDHDAFCAN